MSRNFQSNGLLSIILKCVNINFHKSTKIVSRNLLNFYQQPVIVNVNKPKCQHPHDEVVENIYKEMIKHVKIDHNLLIMVCKDRLWKRSKSSHKHCLGKRNNRKGLLIEFCKK